MQEKKGFTLVELIVTIALLAVITTIIVVNMVALKNKEDDKEQTRVESTIKTAAEAYIEVEGLEQSDSTCVNVRELVQDNYLKEDYVKDYLNNSVKIVKSGDKTTYEIFEGSNCTAKKQKITITFDAMGGVIKNSPNSLTEVKIEKGDNLKSREIPEAYQKYYAFLGWYEDQKYTKKVDEKTKFNQNTTLYAGYQIKEFNIEYQNEGSNSTTQVLRYKENKNLEANPFSKKGYSFVDWSTSDNKIKNIKDQARVNDAIWDYAWEHDNKIELVANFQANNYIVTFDANGEDISISPSSKLVTYDSTYGELPSPKRTYYDFDGWSLKKDIKDEVTSSTKVTTARDHTLYAMWDLHNYKITLDQNGATSKGSTEVETTYGSTNVKVENPQREYTVKVINNAGATLSGSTSIKAEYKFSGWYDEDSKILDESGKFIANTAYTDASGSWIYDGDTTLKANWVAPSITLPKVIKEGYTCGFATSSNGKIEYKSGSSMTPSKNMNLYTVCEANSYVVTYNANGGSVSPNNKTVKYNSTYGSLPTPTRKGYNFLGWYYNNQKITSNSIVKVVTNHTLIAKWEKVEFGVVLKLDVKDKDKDYPTVYFNDEEFAVTNGSVLLPSMQEDSTYKFEVSSAPATVYSNISCVNAKVSVSPVSLSSDDSANDIFTLTNPTNDVICSLSYYKQDQMLINSVRDEQDYTSFYTDSWKKENQTVLDFEMVNLDVGKYEVGVLLSFLRPYYKNGHQDYFFTDTYGSAYWTGYYIHGIRNGVLEFYYSTRYKPCSSECFSHALTKYDLETNTSDKADTDGPVDNDTDDYGWNGWPYFDYLINSAPDYSRAGGETNVPDDIKEQLSAENIDEYLKIFDSGYAGKRVPKRTNLCLATKSGLYKSTSSDSSMECNSDDVYYFKDSNSDQYGVLVTYKWLEGIKTYYKIARIVLRNPNQETDEDESISEQQKRYYVYNDNDNYTQNKYKYNSTSNSATGRYYKMFYILDVTRKTGTTSYDTLRTNYKYYSNGDKLTYDNTSTAFKPAADYTIFVKGATTVSGAKGSPYWWVFRNSDVISAYGSTGTYIKSPNQLMAALDQTQFRTYSYRTGKWSKLNVNLFE